MRICDYSVWLLHDMRENTKENGEQDHYEQRSKRYGIGHSADPVFLRYACQTFAVSYIRTDIHVILCKNNDNCTIIDGFCDS